MLWFFGLEACEILVALPGIKPTPSALEVEVLTTGPGKSPRVMSLNMWSVKTLGTLSSPWGMEKQS